MPDWLSVSRGEAPLIVSVPHAGLEIPSELEAALVSAEQARFDADFHVGRLYDFASELGATLVRTEICRVVIDVNRDPSGASLYPGQATTGLCPTTGFDGTPIYRNGQEPAEEEIARRRGRYFAPYHQALSAEIARLGKRHANVVLYDAHSIRSRVPRLFDGKLPRFNIGTFNGASCDPDLAKRVSVACQSGDQILNGRFKGGWITRHYGAPARGVHAIQMELAMNAYLDEDGPWPPAWDSGRAAPLQKTLHDVLTACLAFAAAVPE